MKKTKYAEFLNLDSTNAKAFNELKANIQFQCKGQDKKVIMISSAEKNEGRSTTAAYLSMVLAKSGKKTILIDCDLRNPNIHNIFNLLNDKGLVNYLAGDIKFDEVVQTTKQKNLQIVTSGVLALNYAELLVSENFKDFLASLKQEFDYIIMDTSPLTVGVDAKAISRYSDACVLVVNSGVAERKTVSKAKEILEKESANIIGVFLNKAN